MPGISAAACEKPNYQSVGVIYPFGLVLLSFPVKRWFVK